jgi:hypothetical protein
VARLTSERSPTIGPVESPAEWRPLARTEWPAYLALVLATLAFFWPMIRPLGARQYIVEGDFSRQFYPFRAFEAREWWSGRIPLWNPDMFGGHPFQADVQTAVFYPLALANALLNGWHTFPFAALEAEVVLHTFLAGLFTYWLARYLTGSRLAGLVAGFAFAFGGFITSYPAQQLPVLETAIWLPLIILFLDLAVGPPVRWRYLVLAGLAFGLSFLAGHSQTTLFIGYATEGYLLWRLWRAGAPRFAAAGSLLLYPLIAAGLSAIQLLPTLAFVPYSTRDQLPYADAAVGYSPSALWEVLVPLWHGEKALSIGVVALALAVIGAWASGREPLAYWTAAGLVAIPLSLGGATPLFWVLYHVAPGWNLFRDQERAIYVFSFAGAVLAGRGVAALQRGGLSGSLTRWIAPTLAVAAAIGALLAVVAPRLGAPPSLQANLALNAFVLGLAAALLFLRPRLDHRRFLVEASLVALVGAELFAINFGNNLGPVSPDPRPRLQATAAFIATFGEPFRVRGVSDEVFPPNYGTLLGLPTIGGDSPIQIRRMRDLLASDHDWTIWQVLNVKFFISDGGQLAGLRPVFKDGNLTTYFMDDSLPRAWAVRSVEVANSPAQAEQLIVSPGHHPGNVVVLEQAPSIGPFSQGQRPDTQITRLEPQRVEIEARADANAMLVLAQQFSPDWQAYRDGQPVTTFRADYLAMAFELPPGQHHYTIVYQPRSLYFGAVITLISLGAVLAFLLLAPGAPFGRRRWLTS